MRLPNGYGSVTKLTGNRRRPYIVKKTLGYNQNGHPLYQIVGYAETKEKGLQLLAEFNNTIKPSSAITLQKLFKMWIPIHSSSVTKSTISNYYNAYQHLSSIVNIPITNIKYSHLQAVIDSMREKGLSYSSCKKVRSLINQLYRFAIINEYIHHEYGQYINLGKNTPVKPHIPFTRQQINKIWNITDLDTTGVLILLYTGMRCNELLNLHKTDINRKSKYLVVVNSKTEAGKNRIIPLHPRIQPIIEQLYASTSDYLFPYSYTSFRRNFMLIMRRIKAKHTTHDCRHTVATLLDRANANPNSIRAILGHKNGDVTIRVYTHKSLSDLRRAINLLK